MKKSRIILEWFLVLFLMILVFEFSIFSSVSTSPKKVLESSESTLYYGPSEIIETYNTKNSKMYLGRYKDWFSLNIINRYFIFWYSGDASVGNGVDYNEKVNFTWYNSYEGNLFSIYGVVNDNDIEAIEIFDGTKAEILIFKSMDNKDMFLICFEGKLARYVYSNCENIYVVGKNSKGEVVFKRDLRSPVVGNR